MRIIPARKKRQFHRRQNLNNPTEKDLPKDRCGPSRSCRSAFCVSFD
jgi:hypothetical protein